MRNLTLQYCQRFDSGVVDVKFLLHNPNIPKSCGTNEDASIFLITASKVYSYQPSSQGGGGTQELFEQPGIVDAEFLALENEICLATDVGEVLTLNPRTGTVSEGTFCDVGIERMSWSPDQEVVVFVTCQTRKVVVMTCTYDVIAEHSLLTSQPIGTAATDPYGTDPYDTGNSDVLPSEPFVSVGWGKKETQFHGSAGKTAAKQKIEFQAPANIDELSQDVVISWRADGAFFAVSFVCPQRGRTFNVFDKEGRLCFNAEPTMGLQPALSWRPSGNWVAVPQQVHPQKSTISLFEKNGLRHREIILPFALEKHPVERLHWSPDSDILAIQTRTTTDEGKNGNITWQLLLFTIGNYHWYHKQTLEFDSEPLASEWDLRIGEDKTLNVMLKNGQFQVYRFHFTISRWAPAGLVAVIDGRKLLLTQFGVAIVPPPMCAYELQLDESINECCFLEVDKGRHWSASGGGDFVQKSLQLAILDAKQRIHIFNAVLSDTNNMKKLLQFQHVATYTHSPVQECSVYLVNLKWANDRRHLLASNDEQFLLIELSNIEPVQNSSLYYNIEISQRFPSTISNVARGKDDFCLVQTLNENHIHRVNIIRNPTLALVMLKDDTNNFSNMSIADNLEWYQTTSNDALIVRFANGCLRIGGQLIDIDVTSYVVSGHFLAYTKLSVLHFVRLAGHAHGTDKQTAINSQPFTITSAERKLERGSKLITSIANDAQLVLQMPRGNLEVIMPRLLALELIGVQLDELRYSEAFELLRKQRINLNILCDHNMRAFVTNVDVFLNEIQHVQWLNLFLSELQNEDYRTTMYASNYAQISNKDKQAFELYPSDFVLAEKVAYLCHLLSEKMLERSSTSTTEAVRFRLPIITALVKEGRIEDALLRVWQQKKEEANVTETTSSTAEESLRYLIILVDVNELYNIALGTYDFGLVLFVAQKSQRDPKEFLPQLNQLRSFELNYRKYKIDVQLKRYARALDNIAHACTAEDNKENTENIAEERFLEAVTHIERYRLYQQALDVFSEHPSRYRRLCVAYADHLRADGHLSSASLMYERGGELAQALASARNVLDWRRVIVLAQVIGGSSEDGDQRPATKNEVDAIALSLVPALEQNDRHEEAYELLRSYGHDFSTALRCLVRGNCYLRAIYEARQQFGNKMATQKENEEDAEKSVIRPALLAYRDQLSSSLKADEKVFEEHLKRLLELREKRSKEEKMQKRGGGGMEEMGLGHVGDESDLFSEAGSMQSSRYTASSRGTGKTFRSSKNRRKHERKLLSLKPGNPFEDCALIDALHNLIVRLTAASQQQLIHDTCRALLELRADLLSMELQKQYGVLLKRFRNSLDDIWTPAIQAGAAAAITMAGGQEGDLLRGSHVDYTQFRNEQRYAVLAPLKRFKPTLNFIEWEHEILKT